MLSMLAQSSWNNQKEMSPSTTAGFHADTAVFGGANGRGVRVDFDIPKRMGRTDVEGFMHFLSGQKLTGVSRVRKLATIRKFFGFLEANKVLATNPAIAVTSARREEKEPNILFKEQSVPVHISAYRVLLHKQGKCAI